ncbi:MAG: carbon starvation CstA family protein [Bacteroidales bacterium]|jgi:carbon starvation protein CstA|nr:hypothetical protein [Bacteroidales bacterium]
MITFILSVLLLIAGYFLYGRFVENMFGVDAKRTTSAERMQDGVDYVRLPLWRIFLIQFLNIAGLGLIGAIAGAMWGPVAFLWVVFVGNTVRGCVAVAAFIAFMLWLFVFKKHRIFAKNKI